MRFGNLKGISPREVTWSCRLACCPMHPQSVEVFLNYIADKEEKSSGQIKHLDNVVSIAEG